MQRLKLTDAAIRTLKRQEKQYTLGDGEGLFLDVPPSGRLRWRFVYRFGGKQKKLALGCYPETGLKRARDLTREAREHVAAGLDPSQVRREKKEKALFDAENTFEAVSRCWLAENIPRWSKSHAGTTERQLERDIFPFLGAVPLVEIRAPLLVETLRRIQNRSPEMARRACISVRAVFRFGLLHGLIEADPSTALWGALGPAPKVTHFPAPSSPKEVGAILRALDALRVRWGVVSYASRLLPLWAVRPGELVSARWADFDFEAKEWRFLSSKTKVPHLVPLSRQALALLDELKEQTGRGEWVFPSLHKKGAHIVTVSLSAHLATAGVGPDRLVPHGWRSVFRTLGAEECGFSFDILEAQLAHKVPDVLGRAYNRAKWLEARRAAMQRWADYLDELKAAV